MAQSSYPRTGRVTGASSVLHLPKYTITPVNGYIVAIHGLQGSAVSNFQGNTWSKQLYNILCKAGFGVLAADFPDWISSESDAVIDACYNDIKALTGLSAPIVNFLASSDGGGQFLHWLIANHAKVNRAFLHAPATDPRWGYALGGYTPAYDVGTVTPVGSWKTGMDAIPSMAGNWSTHSTGYRINDHPENFTNLPNKIHINHAPDDTVIPVDQNRWFVDQVANPNITFRYAKTGQGGHMGQPQYDPLFIRDFFLGRIL